jgi:CTP synthase
MVPEFEKAGLSFVGRDESGRRMEVQSRALIMDI